MINDWMINSESGRSAILDGTARSVQAVKTVYSEELQTNIELTASGDLLSVLDRVNDPFFGLADTNVDLSDPVVVAFLEKMKDPPEQDNIEHHITLTFKPENDSARATIMPGNNPKSLTRKAGSNVSYRHGWCAIPPTATTAIHDATPDGIVDCTMYQQVLWGGSWKKTWKKNNISLDDVYVRVSCSAVGWWNWKFTWHWDTDAYILINIAW